MNDITEYSGQTEPKLTVAELVNRFTMEEIIGEWFKDTANPYGVMETMGEVIKKVAGPLMLKISDDAVATIEFEAEQHAHRCGIVMLAIAKLQRHPLPLDVTNRLVKEVLAHIRTDGEVDVDTINADDLLDALKGMLDDLL